MVKISVIMPVFNDELYLEEAIESVISQTLKDIELICVNDGSSDNSLNILKELEKKYDMIRVYSHENQGVAATRNFAMDVAVGEYLAFLDSDDFFMDKKALEKLFEVAEINDANMASGNLNIFNADGSFTPIRYLKYYDEPEVILPEDYGIPFSFTKAIFKREFIIGNNIRFPLLTKGEDPVFLAEVLSKLDYVYAVPVDVYAYRYIDGSLKYSDYQNYYDQILHYKLVFDYMSDPKFDKYTHQFKYHLIHLFDLMKVKRSEPTLKAIREVFHDDPKTLRQCEEYFYFKFRNNEKLSHLVELKRNPDKPRISIIVPIYNDENNLNSIKNLLKQSLDDLEVICINDGSTDDSLEILKTFQDERLKIIDEENQGYANSKNLGLKESKGEYVYFHDPTINLPKDFLEKLYRIAITSDSDFVLSRYSSTDELFLDCIHENFNLIPYFKGINLDKHVFNYEDCRICVLNSPFSLCNKLYKKEFLDRYDDFYFDSDLAFDDVMFHIKSVLRASMMAFAKKATYKHKFNAPNKYYDSLISKDILSIIEEVELFLNENDYHNEFIDELNLFKFVNMVNHMSFVNNEEYYQSVKAGLLGLNFDDYENVNHDTLIRYFNIIKSDSLDEFNDFENKSHEKDLKQRIKALTNSNAKLKKDNKKLSKRNSKLKKTNTELLESNSWKVTKPLRKIKKGL